MGGEQGISAGIYCRLSEARMGDTTNVDDQEKLCRPVAEARGWRVAAVYKDNSRSAWQRNRKRPAWDQMLADIEAGRISAIVVYHGDRLVRQPFDLETLLNLSYGKGIRLASPTGERDLSNDDDLFILRIEVAAQCRESAAISRRVKNHLRRRAERGLGRTGGTGGRTFGFETDGLTLNPAEAAAAQEAARRLLAGEPAKAICRDLEQQGITGTAGAPLNYERLRVVLMRPQMAGLQPDGKTRAPWEPVLDRQTWEDLCAILDAKGRSYGRVSQGRRFLLSGIAVCGTCRKPAQAWYRKNAPHVYKCVNPDCEKQLSRSQPHLDAYVTGRLLRLLNSREVLDAMRTPPDPGVLSRIGVLEARRDKTRRDLEDLASHPEITPLIAAKALESYTRQIEALRESMSRSAGHKMLGQHAGLTLEEFRDLPLATRRQLVAAAYVITIKPATHRGPGFWPEDVDVALRQD